jgi:hypothetical protein
MRNKTVNFTATPVNRSKPLEFQQVNPSFRLVSPPAMASETELRVVRDSQVAAARIYDFPVSNLNGGLYVQDCQEVQNEQDQARNCSGKDEYRSAREKCSSNGLISPASAVKPARSCQQVGAELPTAPASSSLTEYHFPRKRT